MCPYFQERDILNSRRRIRVAAALIVIHIPESSINCSDMYAHKLTCSGNSDGRVSFTGTDLILGLHGQRIPGKTLQTSQGGTTLVYSSDGRTFLGELGSTIGDGVCHRKCICCIRIVPRHTQGFERIIGNSQVCWR